MFPSTGAGEQPLEDRLRGLILSNAAAANSQLAVPALPPHMTTASPVDQHAYLGVATTSSQTQDISSSAQPQSGRKRLNQAQRRQMNAQLSIPVDPRQAQEQYGRVSYAAANQSGFGFNSSHAFTPQGQYRPSRHYQSNRNYNQNFQPPGDLNYGYQPQQGPSHFHDSGVAASYLPESQQPQRHYNQYSQNGSYQMEPRQSQNHQQHQYQQNVASENSVSSYSRPAPQNNQLYQPSHQGAHGRGRGFNYTAEEIGKQISHLDSLIQDAVPLVGIGPVEQAEKEAFRAVIEDICKEAISQHETIDLVNPSFDVATVQLQCFGSMSSGFATKASDMDLALLTPLSIPAADNPESPIPRLLERKLLDMGYGARLLTRTRVPIIKLCQKPTSKLLADLREERAKWESGFVEEEATETVQTKSPPKTAPITTAIIKEKLLSSPELSPVEPVVSNNSLSENQLSKLKQKESQSLTDYYNTTKRLLRKLSGRDVLVSSPNLSQEEGVLLNEICKAFILGLSDGDLKSRLSSYHSIQPLFDTSVPYLQRSIHGIWIQAEGERLAMAWDNRPLTESNDRREFECLKVVEGWRLLQDKRVEDPVPYNRLLFIASEKLKHISSLRLVFLEQELHEDPFSYYKRAAKILADLTTSGTEKGQDSITPIIISHYISGISNTEMQEAMRKLVQGQTLLAKICLQHRALQLANDYAHALSKGLFEESDHSYIQQYISLLRTPINDILGNEANILLVTNIRSLPDPTSVSQNKPRDKYKDHLEFPKTDIGIQCDINFSAELALHNTLLLRCYSHSDPRVKELILFVKHWAKVRGINTPYRGTLSSYGYVLMVLHYLVNITQPFVCPNLQIVQKDPPPTLSPAEIAAQTTCKGHDVRFWRNESGILDLAKRGHLNHNKDPTGLLLRGFFEYFAQGGQMTTVPNRGFDWGRQVLSLRTQRGILTKQEKGWVGAKTVVEVTSVAAPIDLANSTHPNDNPELEKSALPEDESKAKSVKQKTIEEVKEIRHRYLFAIEDPFEVDHNVARTVTHDGIVQIRDEFRRAWRIISNIGREQREELLEPVSAKRGDGGGLQELLDLLHGRQPS
ncbi:hypothetical protein B0O99DRAFT_196068 [Bisporella sp. PMI_857]|nr:hypothetical protein B0O99DRAFT_196068 [Bisporella sp. PMI_857]